jgi:hypothetical protein
MVHEEKGSQSQPAVASMRGTAAIYVLRSNYDSNSGLMSSNGRRFSLHAVGRISGDWP